MDVVERLSDISAYAFLAGKDDAQGTIDDAIAEIRRLRTEIMSKRGPAPEGQYRIAGRTSVPRELDDLAQRRVMPFMDSISIQTRPLCLILKEVYLQGLRDAVDAIEHGKRDEGRAA